MLLDDLPNDCLLLIFGFIGGLKDLINFYQVSKRWRDLTAVRTKNVKYLFRYPQEMRELTDSLYFDHLEPYNGLILLSTDLESGFKEQAVKENGWRCKAPNCGCDPAHIFDSKLACIQHLQSRFGTYVCMGCSIKFNSRSSAVNHGRQNCIFSHHISKNR